MKPVIKMMVLAAACFFLFGCSVHESRMKEAEMETPDVFSEAKPAQEKVMGAVTFWQDFNDPALNALVQEAQQSNLDIVQAGARINQMEALERQSRASLFPFLNAGGSASRDRQISSQGESTGSTFRMSLAAGYEFDLWEKLKKRRDSSSFQALATLEDYQTIAISVAAQVADLYFQIGEQRMQLELNDKMTGSYKDTLGRIEERYRLGLLPALDVYQARQNVLSVEARRPQFEKRLSVLYHALGVLIGRIPQKEMLGDTINFPQLDIDFSAGIPAELLSRRPDIRAAYLRLQAKDAEIAAAVADKYPSFKITGVFGMAHIDYAGSVSGTFWNLLLELAQPVFDAGRRKAEVERREALFTEALAGYHKSVLTGFQEAEDALSNARATAKQIELLSASLDAADATLQLATDNYFEGLTDYLTVLNTQQKHFEIESQLLTAKRQVVSDRITLYRSLGGAWQTKSEITN